MDVASLALELNRILDLDAVAESDAPGLIQDAGLPVLSSVAWMSSTGGCSRAQANELAVVVGLGPVESRRRAGSMAAGTYACGSAPRLRLQHWRQLLRECGFSRPVALQPRPGCGWRKLCVFVPESHLSQVRGSLAREGAGRFEGYSQCAFETRGTGRFQGEEGSRPCLGEPGKLEQVEEWKLEMVYPQRVEGRVLAALAAAHPYEEPAFDLLPLLNAARPVVAGLRVEMRTGDRAEFTDRLAAMSPLAPAVLRALGTASHLSIANPGDLDSRDRTVGLIPGELRLWLSRPHGPIRLQNLDPELAIPEHDDALLRAYLREHLEPLLGPDGLREEEEGGEHA